MSLSAKKDLRKLSKNELINLFLKECQARQNLEERLKEIEAMLRQYDNPNTPSSQKRFKEKTEEKKKKEQNKESNKPRFPGRENGHKGSGIRIPKPDNIKEHKINKKGYVKVGKRTQTTIEFAENPIVVTKHIIYKYKTPNGQIIEANVDLPEGIYGKNLQALNCLLKGKLGASHESIADLIQALRPDLSFCPATSSNIINNMAKSLALERELILERVRQAFYCNADETGLRHDGENGYVWTFCTPTDAIYETDLTRSGDVPQRVLGKDYDNFVVRDGWQGYNRYKGQRCWPHLTRELDKLAEDYEKSCPEIQLQADYFHGLYKQSLEAKTKPPDERMEFIEKVDSSAELGFMIQALSKIKCCSEFVTKITNARPFLFTGVLYPEIPLDNNHAERILRKIVVHRKLMGCIRNDKGKLFINNVMSCIQTWHLQGKNQFRELIKYAS